METGRTGEDTPASSRRELFTVGGGLAVASCAPDSRAATDDAGLRSAVRGRVSLPGDRDFDQARQPWNLTVEQSVRAVVEVADADDAAALVRYARDTGRTLAAQPTGHGAADALDGAILVRTNRIDEIHVEPGTRSARVGAGVSWAQVQEAAAPHGLTGVTGSAPQVGVTGFTLGGGLSWFSREFGWTADSVTAFDVIDADGGRLRVTASSEPDLFWALRGGGGDYALVTAIEFALHPVPSLYGGRMVWPAERAPQVLAAFREIVAIAPDELTLWWSLSQFPSAPPMVGVSVTYLGDAASAQALLAPLERVDGRTADTRKILPLNDIGAITAEPTRPSPSLHHTVLLTDLTEPAIGALLTGPISPLISVQVRQLGGALTRPSDSAAGAVPERFCVGFHGLRMRPEDTANVQARIRDYLDAFGENATGRTPFGFLAPGQRAADAVDADTLARLRDIKRHRDPKGLFRSNFPV
ncbi:FAD-binding oxidoreductase [Nocardia arthritidis]|uniref:FAD-binding protein n=1 Tax=Nocardia arthritidis TaxID=228602 RepID=A0A6G9YEN0_9NOCA|nr:FAD-binding oxidoreductase [Nocardia arthritidis]QIS11453.1 FAD-binding protein [Nocardia arthritidis]